MEDCRTSFLAVLGDNGRIATGVEAGIRADRYADHLELGQQGRRNYQNWVRFSGRRGRCNVARSNEDTSGGAPRHQVLLPMQASGRCERCQNCQVPLQKIGFCGSSRPASFGAFPRGESWWDSETGRGGMPARMTHMLGAEPGPHRSGKIKTLPLRHSLPVRGPPHSRHGAVLRCSHHPPGSNGTCVRFLGLRSTSASRDIQVDLPLPRWSCRSLMLLQLMPVSSHVNSVRYRSFGR